jgi:hypothetical protein
MRPSLELMEKDSRDRRFLGVWWFSIGTDSQTGFHYPVASEKTNFDWDKL